MRNFDHDAKSIQSRKAQTEPHKSGLYLDVWRLTLACCECWCRSRSPLVPGAPWEPRCAPRGPRSARRGQGRRPARSRVVCRRRRRGGSSRHESEEERGAGHGPSAAQLSVRRRSPPHWPGSLEFFDRVCLPPLSHFTQSRAPHICM